LVPGRHGARRGDLGQPGEERLDFPALGDTLPGLGRLIPDPAGERLIFFYS
jgi:hypothetical protein